MLTQACELSISSRWAPPVTGPYSKEKTLHLIHCTSVLDSGPLDGRMLLGFSTQLRPSTVPGPHWACPLPAETRVQSTPVSMSGCSLGKVKVRGHSGRCRSPGWGTRRAVVFHRPLLALEVRPKQQDEVGNILWTGPWS